jgi:acetylornithine deacetylase
MPQLDRQREAATPDYVGWASRLIAFDTVSRHSNLGLIEAVRDDLTRQGFQARLTYDSAGAKANLMASLPGRSGMRGGIVLSGHTDVVPVDGQDWSSDPFRAEIRDGRLYGRGSADMKGFIGCVMALAPRMAEAGLEQPLHIALSFDEEMGCLGAPLMIADMVERGLSPSGCIVGEPTGMKVVTGHKGAASCRCRVIGRAAHASKPQSAISAISYAARLVNFVDSEAARMRRDGPFDAVFDTPYGTAHVGQIQGGAAPNIIAAECEFVFEERTLPDSNDDLLSGVRRLAADLREEMRATAPEADIQFEPIGGFPALNPDEQADIVTLARRITGDFEVRKVAFGAEAGLFQRAGIPSLVCGPGHIDQAHKPDEFVDLAQLAACSRFLEQLLGALGRAEMRRLSPPPLPAPSPRPAPMRP